MKAVTWEEDITEKGLTLGCEKCQKIIKKGWLITPENDDDIKELDKLFSNVQQNPNLRCAHPDNILVCRRCFSQLFVILSYGIVVKR